MCSDAVWFASSACNAWSVICMGHSTCRFCCNLTICFLSTLSWHVHTLFRFCNFTIHLEALSQVSSCLWLTHASNDLCNTCQTVSVSGSGITTFCSPLDSVTWCPWPAELSAGKHQQFQPAAQPAVASAYCNLTIPLYTLHYTLRLSSCTYTIPCNGASEPEP